MKAYVKISSTININVTSGLQHKDVTNPDAHVADRLKINALWPKMTIPILQGVHWYPAEITEWNTVKRLVKDKVLTIGEFSDEVQEVQCKELKEKLTRALAKIQKEVPVKEEDGDEVQEIPVKKSTKKSKKVQEVEEIEDIDLEELAGKEE